MPEIAGRSVGYLETPSQLSERRRANFLGRSKAAQPLARPPRGRRKRRGNGLVIGIGNHRLAHDLTGFVAFSRHEQNIASLKVAGRHRDRVRAACDLDGAGRRRHDFAPDYGRLLASGVVIGDINVIGMSRSRRAHLGTLSLVPVAAAAKNDVQPAAGIRAQGLQRFHERVRRVGIVHKDGRAACGLADIFEAALCAPQLRKRGEHGFCRSAKPESQPRSDKRVRNLECARERQRDGISPGPGR